MKTIDGATLYLDLIKKCLTGMIYDDPPAGKVNVAGYLTKDYIPKMREYGRDVPSHAHTMIGMRRLDNLQYCVERVIADGVPGDLIETGVWRGGACIFMRAVLKAHGVTDRRVWVADSFRGLPAPDLDRYPIDVQLQAIAGKLAVTQDKVKGNFQRYGLLDDQVCFLEGWFKDTLCSASISQLAVMRLDGDLYESTWDVLTALYERLAPGGFVIIDDYNLACCKLAVTDFRAQLGIREPMNDIDGMGAYWRREPVCT
jgi:Macrocin-O-methyltransferase (TylF)